VKKNWEKPQSGTKKQRVLGEGGGGTLGETAVRRLWSAGTGARTDGSSQSNGEGAWIGGKKGKSQDAAAATRRARPM